MVSKRIPNSTIPWFLYHYVHMCLCATVVCVNPKYCINSVLLIVDYEQVPFIHTNVWQVLISSVIEVEHGVRWFSLAVRAEGHWGSGQLYSWQVTVGLYFHGRNHLFIPIQTKQFTAHLKSLILSKHELWNISTPVINIYYTVYNTNITSLAEITILKEVYLPGIVESQVHSKKTAFCPKTLVRSLVL